MNVSRESPEAGHAQSRVPRHPRRRLQNDDPMPDTEKMPDAEFSKTIAAAARRLVLIAGLAGAAWHLPACSAVESFGEDVSRLGTAGRQWIADVGGDDPRVDSDY